MERDKALEKINGLSDTLISRLIYLNLFTKIGSDTHDPISIRRWKIEVRSYLRAISNITIKGKNKSLSEIDYFEALFDENFGPYYEISLEDLIDNINDNYGTVFKLSNINIEEFVFLIKQVIFNLCFINCDNMEFTITA